MKGNVPVLMIAKQHRDGAKDAQEIIHQNYMERGLCWSAWLSTPGQSSRARCKVGVGSKLWVLRRGWPAQHVDLMCHRMTPQR